jgi:5-(hydroxymethyl)furfural/furfural oxidase
MDADVVIVGAGTAGSVLASRLSEDPSRRVLLLEAGHDYAPGHEPADVSSVYPLSYFNPRYLWPGLQVRWRADRAPAAFAQGRMVGGGSMVMGMWAVRGFPQDYEWEALGVQGWTWKDVLSFFVRAERDLDFSGPLHGRDGPISVRRQGVADWPPFCRAVAGAAQDLGLTHLPDINAEFGDGIAVLPIAATDRRVSAAAAYLTPEVRARPNLRIAPRTECTRVVFAGNRAVGVEVRGPGAATIQRGSEIILCAGALQSPALLMRSGIGRALHLAEHGIAVVQASPGVGENLQNHPVVALGLHLWPHAVQADGEASAAFFCLRTSGETGLASDLYCSVLNRSSWHYFGRRLATLGVMIHKPYSTGTVRLASADPRVAPHVDFRLLSDSRDEQRMLAAVRTSLQLLENRGVAALGRSAGLVKPGKLARALAHRTPATRVLNALCSTVLPHTPRLEEFLVQKSIGSTSVEDLAAASDNELLAHIRGAVSGVFHPVGSCRMGAASDPMAVVDHAGRVHGVHGVRVVDASIMPAIPRAGTFLPTVMIAEKIAAGFRVGPGASEGLLP